MLQDADIDRATLSSSGITPGVLRTLSIREEFRLRAFFTSLRQASLFLLSKAPALMVCRQLKVVLNHHHHSEASYTTTNVGFKVTLFKGVGPMWYYLALSPIFLE